MAKQLIGWRERARYAERGHEERRRWCPRDARSSDSQPRRAHAQLPPPALVEGFLTDSHVYGNARLSLFTLLTSLRPLCVVPRLHQIRFQKFLNRIQELREELVLEAQACPLLCPP